MIKRTCRYVFFVSVYLSGIVIGGVYTPELISYAKEMSAQQEEQIHPRHKPVKKKAYIKPVQLG